MNPPRVLIAGGSGYLGAALVKFLRATRPAWDLHTTYFSHPIKFPHEEFMIADL